MLAYEYDAHVHQSPPAFSQLRGPRFADEVTEMKRDQVKY